MRIFFSAVFMLFCLFISPANSQEVVSGLLRNTVVEDASRQRKYSIQSTLQQNDTLVLPFFDDFSSTTIFPDSRWWTDNYAYINSQYSINPPTIGVATLDALDQNGALYKNASFSAMPADKLTSKYINLEYPADSNIFLSFFYQAGGTGHLPNTTDSLIVQFYAPRQNAWKEVWGIPGGFLQPFKQVIFQVKDTAYLHNAFRFRFMNYSSLTNNSDDPGKLGDNSDWSIDYVYLNKGRSLKDTILTDLAILSPLPSLLSYFESIPWSHFPYAADELMASGKTSVYYHLYSPNPNDSISHNRILKINSSSPAYSYLLNNSRNIHSGTTLLDEPYYDKLNYEDGDSAIYNVTFYLDQKGLNDSYNYRWNDTVRRLQIFKDYYAYDDGTAENGYGLYGQGTINSRVGYQFYSYVPDTLRAIDMYFNKVYGDANSKYFSLTIWDSQNGVPGNILYSKSDTSLYPFFIGRNHFLRYVLDEPVAITDTFYVGWIQTAEGFLNVGLDVNRVNNQKMFFNINGSWQMSTVKGSLMIRPVFGKNITVGNSKKIEETTVKLYPNPSAGEVSIELENQPVSNLTVSFYDLSGKLLLSAVTSREPINLSSLESGLYIVRIDYAHSTPIFRKLRVLR